MKVGIRLSPGIVAILLLFLVTAVGAYLRLVNLGSFSPLISDEGIYAQDAYVLSRGYVPYKDVYLAQPPVFHLVQALFVRFFGASVFVARLPNVLLSVATIPIMGFFTLQLQRSQNDSTFRKFMFPLLSSSFYAVYPPVVYWSKMALVDPMAGFFLLVGALMLVTWIRGSSGKKWLFWGALFLSIACLTKYTVLFFLGPFFAFFSVLVMRRDGLRHVLKTLVIPSVAIFVLPVAIFFGYMTVTQSLGDFFRITIWWQMNLAPMPWEAKFDVLVSFVSEFFLLCTLFALGSYVYLRGIKESPEKGALVVSVLIGFFMVYMYHVPQMQIVLPFVPIASFVAWDGLRTFFEGHANAERSRHFGTKFDADFAILLFLGLILLTNLLAPYSHISAETGRIWSWPKGVNFESQLRVADLIRNNTSPQDKIFTTAAEYAFLASREIVTPDAASIKNQGFYMDMIGLNYKYSFEGPPPEIILPEYYLETLEKTKPKMILKTSGIYASPDDYLWSGYYINDTRHPGLFTYVIQNYALLDFVKSGSTVVEVYRLAEENQKPVSFVFENNSDLQQVNLTKTGACQASLTLSSLSFSGKYSVNMSYIFTDISGTSPIYAKMAVSIAPPLNHTRVRLLYVIVYGDNSGNILWVTFDSKRGSSGVSLGPINWQGWRILSVDPNDVVYPDDVDLERITGIGVSVDYKKSSSGHVFLDSVLIPIVPEMRESD